MLSIIVAMARNGVIGLNGQIPWSFPEDLRRFKHLTVGKSVIMGRKTWESLPRKPLMDRQNIVMSRTMEWESFPCYLALDSTAALGKATSREIMVIGGAAIYASFLPLAERMYVTEIERVYEGDVLFPAWDREEWKLIYREKGRFVHGPTPFTFNVLERRGKCGGYPYDLDVP